MPRLVFSERFADDFARVTSAEVEQRILDDLDNIEAFGGFGSRILPESILEEFGDVRKVAINPFDLIYTLDAESDVAYIEALIFQHSAR